MNSINKFFLKIALLPAFFYKKIGVDTYKLQSLLVMKLIMDDRRVSALQQTRDRKKNKPVKAATLGSMFISLVMGFMYLFAFAFGENRITHFTFFFSFYIFMLATMLIADFTNVLIDVRDNQIILPKPVNDKTVVVVRLLHIFVHICKLIIPMSLPVLVFVAVQDTVWKMLLMLPVIFLATMFTIFVINAMYILILKITTPARFQSILSYFQIVFAVVVYGAYQVVPRMMEYNIVNSINFSAKWYAVFFPPYWFACAIENSYRLGGSLQEIISALIGFLFPFISIYVVIKFLAPTFTRKMSLITSVDTTTPSTTLPAQNKKAVKKKTMWLGFWNKLLTRKGTESAAFDFTYRIASRSRDFRIKVYPSIGYILVYIFIMFFRGKNLTLSVIQEEAGKGRGLILSAIYFTCFLLIVALGQLHYSEKYKASWIYFITPLNKPGEVISGAAKSMIVKFYVPFVLIISITGLSIVGIKFLPNLLFGLSNVLLATYLLIKFLFRKFPFSKAENNNVKTGKILRNIFIMIFPILLATGHYFIYQVYPAVILLTLISAAGVWYLADSVKRTDWNVIQEEYAND